MDEVLALRDFIYAKTGMYLPDGRRYLFEGQFLKRMEALGISAISKYSSYLMSEESQDGELRSLVREIANSESSSFEAQARFRALEEIFIPALVGVKEKAGIRKMKIWNAGCGTGEEAHAAAIILHHLAGGILSDWKLEVWATDDSPSSLERAKRGIYQDYSLRGIPSRYKEAYMVPTDGGYSVSDSLKTSVCFEAVGLGNNQSIKSLSDEIDIIHCGQRLIHLEAPIRKGVVESFYNSLVEGGYLTLGTFESLHGIKHRFHLVHYPGGMAYRK